MGSRDEALDGGGNHRRFCAVVLILEDLAGRRAAAGRPIAPPRP